MNLMLIAYGNGTQIVRVEGETDKVFIIRRYKTSEGYWYPNTSKLKKSDPRIYIGISQEVLLADLTGRMQAALQKLQSARASGAVQLDNACLRIEQDLAALNVG